MRREKGRRHQVTLAPPTREMTAIRPTGREATSLKILTSRLADSEQPHGESKKSGVVSYLRAQYARVAVL